MKKPTRETKKQTDIASTDFYKYIIENCQEAILLTRPDGTIDYANPEACKLFGMTQKEICKIGRNGIIDLNDSRLPLALEIRKKTSMFKGELNFVKKNGKIFPGEISSVIFKDEQEIERTSMIIRDLSEIKEAEMKTQLLAHTTMSIEEIITITDLEDRFTFVNQAFCNIYGYSYEEILGQHVSILLSPNNPPDLLKNVLNHSHTDGWKGEILNLTKDGKEFPIYLQTSQIFNEIGEIMGLAGISEDITERKQAELELKKNEEKYHAIFEATGTATLIVENDTTISMANNECEKITGYKKEELIGTKWTKHVDPSNLQEILKYHKIRRQNPELAPKNYEVKIIHKNGEIRDAILDIGMIPGTKQSIVSILDITKRKQAEEALKEGDRKLTTLVGDLPGFIYRCNNDKNWTMIFISDACLKITGYSPKELINNNKISFNDIILPKYQEYLWEKWQKVLSEKSKFEDEYEIQTASGETRWVWERGNGIFDDKDELLYLEGYIEDITERKRIEESLKISEEKFRKVFKTSPDSININRLSDGMYAEINKGFTETTGFTEEDVRGKSSLDINIWGNTDDRKKLLEELKKDGTVKNLEYLFRKKNGELNSGLMSATIIDLNGISHIISITRDITERKKAEEAIKKSELQFRTLFMSLSEGFYISEVIYDEKGNPCDYKYVEVNPKFEKIIGLNRDQIIGKRYKEIVTVDTTNWLDNYFTVATTGVPRTFEFYSEEYNTHFETYAYRPFENQVCVFVRDISERKKAVELIRESERKFRETMENLQEGYYKCTIEGILQEYNPAFKEILGFDAEKDLRGLNLPDFWQNPNDREKYLKNMTQFGHIKNYLVNAKKTNGEKMYLLVNSHLLKNNKDEYSGIEGTILDFTEQKRKDDALKMSEHKYRNLIETMPEGFYRSSQEGYFVDTNSSLAKMLGYENKEELMKVYIPQALYFTEEERFDGVNYNIDFTPDTEVYRLKKKDGSEIWIEDHARYIRDDFGNIAFREGIMRDITETIRVQKAMIEGKEKAEGASRLKSSFLANMSHEIRTPLNGILGFSQILKNELKDNTLIRYADIIEKSGNRLLETLDMILGFSKLEAEREDVHYSNVKIENVIDEVIKSFEAMASGKNLYIKSNIEEENLVTKIDERFLRQILNNLINNAIKYTNAGGIEVELSKEDKEVVIKVKDTGIGIAKDKHDVIFKEFRQESEGHGRSFEGTGLGLAITKRFVELMRGKIEVDSELGVGTTFTVRLPYEKAKHSISIKIKKEEHNKEISIPITEEKEKLSVLIVENDIMNLDYTIAILKDYFDIESAVDGVEALNKVKLKIFDIILMDINLGKGINGIEVTRKIRKLPEYEKTPIVALTAFVLPGDREEFLASGCTHYLGKPFTKNQILELLKNISEKNNISN